jgi:hypothetical protein
MKIGYSLAMVLADVAFGGSISFARIRCKHIAFLPRSRSKPLVRRFQHARSKATAKRPLCSMPTAERS